MTTKTEIPEAEKFSPGMPVEVGQIDRELKKLWLQSGDAKTRASLINLAIYSEAPDSLAKNTAIISKITDQHACRALVIAANPSAKKDRVESWISAHCHVRSGNQQICSEQLSFLLEGGAARLLPNTVFSQLDSDLPFYLWWQDEFHDPMDPQLWAWVDRLIYDSKSWKNFGTQMSLVETALAEAKQRVVLCDLNWTRIVQVRLAIAQFFDHPKAREALSQIDRLELDFAAGFHTAALLLVGWLAAQLGWQLEDYKGGGEIKFTSATGQPIVARLDEKDGTMISRCALFSARKNFSVRHAENCDLLEISASCGGAEQMHQRTPAGSDDPVRLMNEELMRGGPHRVYLRAVAAVRPLL